LEAQPFASDEKLAVRWLMTIGGVHMTVALGGLAAIGDIARFSSPDKLVSCLGLHPSVRQSGNGPAHHSQITKQGRSHAQAMLVGAAWAAARVPGPLRAFFLRIQRRRGQQIAAVATARKMVVIVWHLLTTTENYAWARSALLEANLRRVELAAGQPAVKGRQQGGTRS
jgi:transposase